VDDAARATGAPDGKEAAIVAYIVSENIRRRHLNAGQRAILIAIAYPEPTRLKRAGSSNLIRFMAASCPAPAAFVRGRRR
jgi:hypothetical protein